MRVSMNTMYDQIKTDLSKLTDRMNQANSEISSGKIYQKPSDAPVELSFAMGLRGNVSESKQHMRNISYAKAWLTSSETSIRQLQGRLQRAKTLALQGANDTQNAESRHAIAVEIKTILEETVALGNTKLGDRYVFAGTKTTGYQAGESPFMLDSSGNVTYTGNLEDISIEVSQGIKKTINKNGFESIEKSGVFNSLNLLYNALESDNRADIEVAILEIDKSLEYFGVQISDLGSIANTFANRDEIASKLVLTNTVRLADIEDADYVVSLTDLKTAETAYQASLSSSAKIMSLSLVDYVK